MQAAGETFQENASQEDHLEGMKNMEKIFDKKNKTEFGRMGIIIAITIIAAVIVAFAVFYMLREEGTIKIGAVLSLSGPGAGLGLEVREGMLLAMEEVNSRGGINGRHIELIVEDSKTKREEGKIAFNRIEATHHPVLYVSILSSVSIALAPLAEEHKVVLVGLGTAAPILTGQKDWVFRYWILSERQIPPIISILEELRVEKLGILHLNDEYGTSVSRLLKEEFEKTGGITKAEAYNSKETEFKEPIRKLKAMEAIEAVYVVGYSSHLVNALKALKRDNFGGLILSSSAACHYAVRNLPEAQGMYLSAYAIYDPNFLFARETKEKYEAKYERPFNHRAANGYDFIRLLAGLLRDKEISRENVKSLLEGGFIYPGIFGTIEVKPGERNITFSLHPARIVDGEIEYLR